MHIDFRRERIVFTFNRKNSHINLGFSVKKSQNRQKYHFIL